MDIQVIFENKDLIAINKPSGLVVHSDGKTNEKSLVDWILENYPEMSGIGEPLLLRHGGKDFAVDRPGIVHRLDKETSGIMILAKNQESYSYLKKQFQDRQISKKYICVVWGNIKENEGVIDEPIGKSRNDFRQWQSGKGSRGLMREAITYFRVLKRIEEKGEHFCVCEVGPKTGRTHQIRVHMKYIQHPLVCDSLYSPNRPNVLGFERLALHAFQISFKDIEGKEISLEAPLPAEFQKLLVK